MSSITESHIFLLMLLFFFSSSSFLHCQAMNTHYEFHVKEAWYERLCNSKKILTVNGQFPGPTLFANKGDTIYVDVYNGGNYNISIHWHGAKQLRNPWTDGPSYITQCPIQPGKMFRQRIILSDEEEGTIWWHAHSDWSRATVHGAIFVYPKPGTSYPFPQPYAQVPIIFGEWWKEDVMEVLKEFLASGGPPINSDAYTINGQPGDLYPCSKNDTFQLQVSYGKTYLLRMVNAALNEILFFAIANHKLTVVGIDGSYTKPLTTDYIAISPGQTLDCLLHANQTIPNQSYYMAARAYMSALNIAFDNTTTTAILKYLNGNYNSSFSSSPIMPNLPDYNDTTAAINFSGSLRSLANQEHPIDVPLEITKKLVTTVSINAFPCETNNCTGINGTRLGASMNNISFVAPTIDILEAYYYHIKGVYNTTFPNKPPFKFNYTAEFMRLALELANRGTELTMLKYNATVEITFQGTNLVAGIDHPMHLHGYSFYVVGWGLGNFDKKKDPINYNLIDPPLRNTIAVPKNGWTTIRFRADNPGVWYMHCHLERHLSWGMSTVFIVKDGKAPAERLLPRPSDMPPC